jgi:hypothetical protein
MMRITPIILNFIIVGLFLYSKLFAHRDKLYPQFKSPFGLVNKLFTPIFDFSKKIIKPYKVGKDLSIDPNHFILLIILLFLINIL